MAKKFTTKNTLAYNFLKTKILKGDLRPGERIRVAGISRALKVSDIPVREALKQLEKEKLITIVPHLGARVINSNLAELEELHLIRSHLEILAIRLAPKYMKKEKIARLKKLLFQFSEKLELGKHEELRQVIREFHLQMCAATPYKILYNMIAELWERCLIIPNPLISSTSWCKKSLQNYKMILDALEKGDGEAAAKILEKHRTAVRNMRSKLAKEGITGAEENGSLYDHGKDTKLVSGRSNLLWLQ